MSILQKNTFISTEQTVECNINQFLPSPKHKNSNSLKKLPQFMESQNFKQAQLGRFLVPTLLIKTQPNTTTLEDSISLPRFHRKTPRNNDQKMFVTNNMMALEKEKHAKKAFDANVGEKLDFVGNFLFGNLKSKINQELNENSQNQINQELNDKKEDSIIHSKDKSKIGNLSQESKSKRDIFQQWRNNIIGKKINRARNKIKALLGINDFKKERKNQNFSGNDLFRITNTENSFVNQVDKKVSISLNQSPRKLASITFDHSPDKNDCSLIKLQPLNTSNSFNNLPMKKNLSMAKLQSETSLIFNKKFAKSQSEQHLNLISQQSDSLIKQKAFFKKPKKIYFENKIKVIEKFNDKPINESKQHIKLKIINDSNKKLPNDIFIETMDSNRYDEIKMAKKIVFNKKFDQSKVTSVEDVDDSYASPILSSKTFIAKSFMNKKKNSIHDLEIKQQRVLESANFRPKQQSIYDVAKKLNKSTRNLKSSLKKSQRTIQK